MRTWIAFVAGALVGVGIFEVVRHSMASGTEAPNDVGEAEVRRLQDQVATLRREVESSREAMRASLAAATNEATATVAPKLRDPDAFFIRLFNELGLPSLSECESEVKTEVSAQASPEDAETAIDERARQIYASRHARFRATILGDASTFRGYPEPPFVLDGNLDRHMVETNPSEGRSGRMIYVVPTAPDQADVDVFETNGKWPPHELCFTARCRAGWWSFEREYESFCEAYAPWTAGE